MTVSITAVMKYTNFFSEIWSSFLKETSVENYKFTVILFVFSM